MTGSDAAVRVDSWVWAVRLAKTRSEATTACKGGHVRINGERIKPAQRVRVGDEVRVRRHGYEHIVEVSQLISKRVSASVATTCYIDHSPPRPDKLASPAPVKRDKGAGRPTKRQRRQLDRLHGRR